MYSNTNNYLSKQNKLEGTKQSEKLEEEIYLKVFSFFILIDNSKVILRFDLLLSNSYSPDVSISNQNHHYYQ
jgi:hypothetical protein